MTQKNARLGGDTETGEINSTNKEEQIMDTVTPTTDAHQWNRPDWDRPDWDHPPVDLELRESIEANGDVVVTWVSDHLVDSDALTVDITREDKRDQNGVITEGPLQIEVWAGGNDGFTVSTPHDLLRCADDLRRAAREATILMAHEQDLDTFEFRSCYLPEFAEHHIVRFVHRDGREEQTYLRSPMSRPQSNHWHPADVAEPGQWWDDVDGMKAFYVCRVKRVEGFKDLWVETPATPLDGYKGERPHEPESD